MHLDTVLSQLNESRVEYLLIGGMAFFLRHKPCATFDMDFWINDTKENRMACERALARLDACWGRTDEEWQPVADKSGWLDQQSVYCLTSPHGSIDIFRAVKGLPSWNECRKRAISTVSGAGVSCWVLGDADMLQCQLILDERDQKKDRIRALREVLSKQEEGHGPL